MINYTMLPTETVAEELKQQRSNFLAIYETFQREIQTPAERTYFSRALNESTLDSYRIPQFYGTYKVHKSGPPKMRPIVSCVNSLPEIFSKWVNYWLTKCVATLVPTYIKDSLDLINTLHLTFPHGLPMGAKLFSADAISMYSNIDTDHGITVIKTFLTLHEDNLPPQFPKRFLIASLTEIMKNNIFQFGDTFW
jgi:hypothetical protein